ncbi:predicted protein [Streptomyces iranensis]|uniref:Uncharacterized protein n=1 Tax=Streptomyces iranensis TaxID=576784 RepID=A0A061A1U1_9ACTN|nr:predicted protein [Streptomyces iranensis]
MAQFHFRPSLRKVQ